MKRQIRQSVFETNSSSTHAICISKKKVLDTDIPPYIKFNHGKFGWNFNVLDSVEDRASYLYQAICDLCYDNEKAKSEYINSIYSVLSKYGVECEFDLNDKDEYGWSIGYIDHGGDTRGFVESIMHSEKRLLRYLFGDSLIITGNDNEDDFSDYMKTNCFDDYEVFRKGN